MQEFTCEHTGRVFTNPDLYRQHVRDWPSICERNGLNLDGTSKDVISYNTEEVDYEETEEIVETCALPEDLPMRHVFKNLGTIFIEDVPQTFEELIDIKGIGESSAKDILAWFDDQKDE